MYSKYAHVLATMTCREGEQPECRVSAPHSMANERARVLLFRTLNSFSLDGTTQLYKLISLHLAKQYGTKVSNIPYMSEFLGFIEIII